MGDSLPSGAGVEEQELGDDRPSAQPRQWLLPSAFSHVHMEKIRKRSLTSSASVDCRLLHPGKVLEGPEGSRSPVDEVSVKVSVTPLFQVRCEEVM